MLLTTKGGRHLFDFRRQTILVLYSVSIFAGKVDMDLHDILVWIAYVQNVCTEVIWRGPG